MRAQAFDGCSMDSDQLMQLVQAQDDEVAFAELFQRCSPQAHRLAQAICHDADGTDLAVQEAFVSMWTGRQTYRAGRGGVEAWIMSIVRHRAIAVARSNGLHAGRSAPLPWSDGPLGAVGGDVADAALVAEDAGRLRALLLKLPAAQRDVIGLAFYGQLTHREIAERLDLPPGTIKGRMRLGLQKLRAEIED